MDPTDPMDIVILIGRVGYGVVFVAGALSHFTRTDYLAGYAGSMGVRSPRETVLLAGAWILTGAALLALGVWPDLGALMLFAFLLPTALLMHPFWREPDRQARATEQLHFSKDISLAGAALALFGLFAAHGDGIGLQLTGPLFHAIAG